MNCGLARTERITANRQRLSGETHQSFRIDAVRLARFAVALIAKFRNIHQSRTQRGSELNVETVAIYQRSACVLEDAAGTTILQALTSKSLRIVARGKLIAVAEIPVAFSEIDVLIKSAIVVVDARCKVVHCRSLEGIDRSGQRDENLIATDIALAVVVEEEKHFVFYDRTSDIAAELVEVVSRLEWQQLPGILSERALQAVDRIIGVLGHDPGRTQMRFREESSFPIW